MTTPPSGRPRLTQRIIAVSAALACALLTSCHAGTTQPTPPPTTHVATHDAPTSAPSSSSSPTATSSDALYDEAERVFRAYYKEHEKATRAGGFTTMPASMKQYVTGDFEDAVVDLFRTQRNEGNVMRGGRFSIRSLRVSPSQYEGYEVRIRACTDASNSTIYAKSGRRIGPGNKLRWDVNLSQDSDAIRIGQGTTREVHSC